MKLSLPETIKKILRLVFLFLVWQECKKMPEQKPYPVEKQACHDDEKKVCEQKEISQPKQIKKYVYKKECKKVPREICSTATYKTLEVCNDLSTYWYRSSTGSIEIGIK